MLRPGPGSRRSGPATVTRRLCTVAGFYKYAVEEELLDHAPAAHVRRPLLDYESHATGLGRNEMGALLVAAGLGPAAVHALISLLALNGLRVSEATGALGLERGHRTLAIVRKGGKHVVIPLAPQTARAIDPGHRVALRGPSIPVRRRAAPRPARGRADRARGGPPGRHCQADRTPYAEARIYHRSARRKGAAEGGRFSR